MKRAGFVVAFVLPVLLGPAGSGSPLAGKHSLGYVDIPAQKSVVHSETFRGGERACVIVIGDHEPGADLGVFIYDQEDQLVAEDRGGGDFVAAIWYPPRDARYKIKVHNPSGKVNKCWIALK